MKKHLFLLMAVSVFAMNLSNALAQNRVQAHAFLNRTNKIIVKAKGAVNVGKVYTGDVVKAVYHQRFARSLYREGKFQRAIHHSYRARELSFAAIRANKHQIEKEHELRKEEQALIKGRPDNAHLDAEIEIPKGADDKAVMQDKEDEVKE
jgi:hypothetical protein